MRITCRGKPSSTRKEGFILRAVIFANGKLNNSSKVLSQVREDDLIIAADGGAHHCLDLNLKPDIVIGDMDSISPTLLENLKNQETNIFVYPVDKDQTDLELALDYALRSGVKEVLFFGVLGGRLDLSLANLFLLSRDEWKSLTLVVIDEPDTAYLMRDGSIRSIFGNPGDTVSLIPLSETVTEVSTQGLRWQLNKVDLTQGNTLSVSNELIKTSAKVQIGKGKMLLIHRDTQTDDGEE